MAQGDLPRHTAETVKAERPRVRVYDYKRGYEVEGRLWQSTRHPDLTQIVYGFNNREAIHRTWKAVANALNANEALRA